jgi:hypothetical protein
MFLLDNAGTLDAGDVFSTWWPVVVIVAGAFMFFANPTHWVVPLLIVAAGIGLLLSTLDIADIGAYLWPGLLVIVGLIVIFGRRPKWEHGATGDTVSNFTVFSGSELVSRSQQFQGGNLTALFGGVQLDLRDAGLASPNSLDVFAAFGAVEITVPHGWHVVIKGFPLFGGFENATTKESVGPDAPTLVVNGTAMFGGIEIKH